MSDFSRELIARSRYRDDGFAAAYDAYRPAPPTDLARILALAAGASRPRLVVDLGSGTGLSTRYWSPHADEVVGVEANAAMAAQARRTTGEPNVRYLEASADDTRLPAGAADVVTCAQSFHWMEPEPVLAEAARLLRRGGVFAAIDYDVPPAIHPEVDAAFAELFAERRRARRRLRIEAGAVTWPKEKHLERIRASGAFRRARELVCHDWDTADAERMLGLAETLGGPRTLFGGAAPEVDDAFARFAAAVERHLGARPRPLLWCYRIRLGAV